MATHRGTISWKAKELARTIVSGPIGGVIGAKNPGEALGYNNIACSDIGGTSFDVALITQGELTIKNDPDMAHLVLSLPLVAMDSVGSPPIPRRSSWGRIRRVTAWVSAGRKAVLKPLLFPTATWFWVISIRIIFSAVR